MTTPFGVVESGDNTLPIAGGNIFIVASSALFNPQAGLKQPLEHGRQPWTQSIFQQQKGSSMPSLIGVARVVRIQADEISQFRLKNLMSHRLEMLIHDEIRGLLNGHATSKSRYLKKNDPLRGGSKTLEMTQNDGFLGS